jgi:hypothetical protein
MTAAKRPKVIIRDAPVYDPAKIEAIVREGIEELGLTSRVRGRITIKPNLVMAHAKIAPSASSARFC